MVSLQKVNGLCRGLSFRRILLPKINAAFFSTATGEELDNELKLEYLDGDKEGIAVMSINRPAARNSFSRNLLKLFEDHFETLSANSNIRTVILRSVVPKVFCAGADLKERKLMTEAEVPIFVTRVRMLLHRFSQIPVPTIAALEGAALGGGLELALACDFRIASTSAKLGLPETKLAIIPGAGGTIRLPRIVGLSKAKELIFTGKILNNKEAEAIGLVNYSVDQNDNGDAAYIKSLDFAKEIIGQGPIALKMAKKSINEGFEADLDEAMLVEERCYAEVIPTEDRLEALQAFAEKRKPIFRGK